jgi:hypothetical protein
MPDSRVQAAIDNWGPRFTSQGVDYNDFIRTTRAIERGAPRGMSTPAWPGRRKAGGIA